ncbi:hypothetical protein [Thiocystis violacea]|uniref:hypothetical protein n=1 Tax=Thiocystis violacea TaxID=13725 RepID=UPI001904619A|nr:hypothetical protein [Thiocystis violacea]MBK1717698.1 hypothetical protein [Thiocystis violacea]
MDYLSHFLSHAFRSPLSASSTFAALLAITPVVGYATLLDVSIDTTAYNGTSGFLAFDFLDGDELANNSVTVSDFYTDGTLGSAAPSGSVSGSVFSPDALTLSDAEFYNSLSQQIRFGTWISFTLDLTQQGLGSPVPDSLLFLLARQ